MSKNYRPYRFPSEEFYERKVHLFRDNHGATYGIHQRPFANTLCKMNTTSPEMRITTDPELVTCRLCLKDIRFPRYDRPKFDSRDTPILDTVFYGCRGIYPLPTPRYNALPTRVRLSKRGRLILQVFDTPVWRDAKVEDLTLP